MYYDVFVDCNSECKLGKWECTDNECPGICSVWGDSHFKTFDSRYYDFQGACEYVLSKGTLTSYESFAISIEVSCYFIFFLYSIESHNISINKFLFCLGKINCNHNVCNFNLDHTLWVDGSNMCQVYNVGRR